jgi:hypothetical protein
MDQRPHDIEAAIDHTRAQLDHDLARLSRRIDVLRNQAAAQAQWWGGIAAVAAGAVGAVVLWPRRARA